MWQFMEQTEPSVFVQSNEEGVKRVRENGKYAFLTGNYPHVSCLPTCPLTNVAFSVFFCVSDVKDSSL